MEESGRPAAVQPFTVAAAAPPSCYDRRRRRRHHPHAPFLASGVPSVMQTVRHIARVSRERESRHTRGGILAVALSRARSREPMPEAVENEVVKPEKPWRPKTVCFLGVFAY